MSFFSITRTDSRRNPNIPEQTPTYLQQNEIHSEQHVNKDFYNSSTHEGDYLLPFETCYSVNEYWEPLASSSQYEKNTQDMNSFFNYHGLVEDNIIPECNKIDFDKDTIYTDNTGASNSGLVNYSSMTYLDSKRRFRPRFLSKDKILSSGGKLTWQQTVSTEKRPRKDDYVDFLNQFKSSAHTATSIKNSALPDFITGNTQTNDMDSANECNVDNPTDFISTSISEPLPNDILCPSYLSEPRKRANSLHYLNNLDASNTLEAPLPDEYHQHQSDPVIYMTLNNSADTYSDPCFDNLNSPQSRQMLLAMPRRQKPRYEGDYYTPKWVRYTGHHKEGYCSSCNPGKWLQLKNSAYWYHKQFYHGISSVTGKQFKGPLEQRIGKGSLTEGLCHQCQRFVPVCNSKKKNNYMLWYRHAHKCHLHDKSKIPLKQ